MTITNAAPYPKDMDSHGTTYKTALAVSDIGKAVKPAAIWNAANGITVSAVTANEAVLGRLAVVEGDGFCNVQDRGYIEFISDGTTPTLGMGVVGGASAGAVKGATQANGGRGIIVSYDMTALTVLAKF